MDATQSSSLIGIGELARSTGLTVRTIRFYCDEGILESRRSAGGHRMFEADRAVERLLLIRRLRSLGLGLDSIGEVVRGQQSIAEAVAAESVRLDVEFRSLAWRRAALRAIGAAAPAQRARRLALLAAAQDAVAAHDALVRFWRRVLARIPRGDVDGWIHWNIPQPPDEPSPDEILAYAELVALAADPDMKRTVRKQFWRHDPELIRDPGELYAEIGSVMAEVVGLLSKGVRPRVGGELDRFVHAHAEARGQRDSPHFRELMLVDATDSDRRIHRYWALTARFLGTRVTVGQAHDWIFDALVVSADRG
ncbi:MerR family transcriptional regulator [Nocardia bovistercoris]|uniref:MerR family transcriptional regulator n=1 Tax=Nocardia bovistercoris TaxID=2785916 RepID=A0A931I7V3_9NOCA|nr:MerR family transcriptional regulator [Nocardia bovistercoris]MBH0776474.1 MerR family transcriptional regulator [Nocardia bovistercoris]